MDLTLTESARKKLSVATSVMEGDERRDEVLSAIISMVLDRADQIQILRISESLLPAERLIAYAVKDDKLMRKIREAIRLTPKRTRKPKAVGEIDAPT